MAGVDLTPEVEAGGASHVGAGPDVLPGSGVQAGAHRHFHEPVIGGVVVDPIQAVAEPIVGAQDGRVGVGRHPPLDALRIAGPPAQLVQTLAGPSRPVTRHTLQQRRVGREQVVALEPGRLVAHLVGRHAAAQLSIGSSG